MMLSAVATTANPTFLAFSNGSVSLSNVTALNQLMEDVRYYNMLQRVLCFPTPPSLELSRDTAWIRSVTDFRQQTLTRLQRAVYSLNQMETGLSFILCCFVKFLFTNSCMYM